MDNLEQLATRLDNLQTSLALIKYDLENALKEQEKPQVETPWYDFTDEQKENLGEIVRNFIDNLTSNMRSVDIDLSEGNVNVNITLDLQDLIYDALPYGISDKFIEYLEDEITEQGDKQHQDC